MTFRKVSFSLNRLRLFLLPTVFFIKILAKLRKYICRQYSVLLNMPNKKTILVAPLHWGLGHATRCVPIVRELLNQGYQVLLGSDGAALELLRKEFPQLPFVELPSYQIRYSKKGTTLKWKLFAGSVKIWSAVQKEKKIIHKLVTTGQIQGIISDNRWGVRHKKVPSVYITHQLRVLSGKTTWLTTLIHTQIIQKFDACWVPDTAGEDNLSGQLGHPRNLPPHVSYIGVLSRMKKKVMPPQYDLLVLLSGPEPQRTLLEEKLKKELSGLDKKIAFVLGKMEKTQSRVQEKNFTLYNYLTTKDLEEIINRSSLIISRSGYTTLMDLAAMGKKAFFIPTPGQYEQEYLAQRLDYQGIVPYSTQANFKATDLEKASQYSGLQPIEVGNLWKSRFILFEGKRKF